jgi:hypothetical protein
MAKDHITSSLGRPLVENDDARPSGGICCDMEDALREAEYSPQYPAFLNYAAKA